SSQNTEYRNPLANASFLHNDTNQPRNPFNDTYAVELESVQSPPEPYHVFTKKEKWFAVLIVSAAGFCSTMSSSIYYPALNAISRDLQSSQVMVSFMTTSYLVIQGISPLVWGSISDALGRRPAYLASFAVYILANLILIFSPNLASLVVLRGLQAAGEAPIVSIGNGFIQDISDPATRGLFIGFYQASSLLTPEARNFSLVIGPILGSLLTAAFGFRSIFSLLLVLSFVSSLLIICFLPETSRAIAKNGSSQLSGIYKPLIQYRRTGAAIPTDRLKKSPQARLVWSTVFQALRLLRHKDILIILVFSGVVYAVWCMVMSSTPKLFKLLFGLDNRQLNVVLLSNGFGAVFGPYMVGYVMRHDYTVAEMSMKTMHGYENSAKQSKDTISAELPIERARLRKLPWILIVLIISIAAYGLSVGFPSVVERSGWIAVPLIFHFFIAGASNAVITCVQTLVIDLCPGKGASASAITNLVMCVLAAIGNGSVESFLAATGPGATFIGLALVMVVVCTLAVAHWCWGQRWRVERLKADERAKTKKTLVRSS
ncbi:putative transporter AQR1, partial [Colletotrichum chlorophyti]